MHSKLIRKVLIVTAALMLTLVCAASAASTVYIMEDTTVYAKPDEDSKQYGTLRAGGKYTMVRSGNGWAELKSGNSVGYVRLEDVDVQKTYSGETVWVDGGAALQKSFNADSLMMSLEDGTAVKLYATAGDWAYIKVNGKYGLVKVEDLTTEKPSNKQETEEKTETVKAYVSVDGAKAYKKASSSSKVLAKLDINETVNIVSVDGGWARVEKNGAYGYMKTEQLSTEKTDAVVKKTFTAYVKQDGAKAYDSYDGKGNAVKTFNMDDKVTVKAYNSTWAQVAYGGETMYMKVADLSTEKNDKVIKETYTAYAKQDGVKAYDSYDGKGSVVKTFKVNGKVTVVARNSKWAQVKADGKTMYMKVSDLSREKINTVPDNGSTVMPATGTAKKADWWESDIRSIFPVGKVVTITDVETGIAWQVKRSGGTNHADVQPLTKADTAAMKKVYGGKWSWDRRAVFVTIDGVNYAASINGMPHGSGNRGPDNDFDGHHCIHFTNSRTHGTNKKDADHQEAINKAASVTLD